MSLAADVKVQTGLAVGQIKSEYLVEEFVRRKKKPVAEGKSVQHRGNSDTPNVVLYALFCMCWVAGWGSLGSVHWVMSRGTPKVLRFSLLIPSLNVKCFI